MNNSEKKQQLFDLFKQKEAKESKQSSLKSLKILIERSIENLNLRLQETTQKGIENQSEIDKLDLEIKNLDEQIEKLLNNAKE